MGSATRVFLSPAAIVDDFRKQVKAENGVKLREVDAKNLTVYLNIAAFVNRETVKPLEEDAVVSGYGDSKKNALVVVVPNKTSQQGIIIPRLWQFNLSIFGSED
jgi:hypothetical protein